MPEITPRLRLKKPYGYETVKRQNFNDNWDALEEKAALMTEATAHKNMSPIDHPDGSVTDNKIGERTPDQAQVPSSPGTGKITQIFSWITNRIKAITGKPNWWDVPSVSLEAASTHMGSTNAHSATSEAIANRIMMRDANGRVKVAAPSAADDVARKDNVDTVQTNLNTHTGNINNPHNTTAAQVGAPTSIDGVANPGGNIDFVAGTGITITPDDPNNKITITATGGTAPGPHASTHASGGSDPVSPASIGAETPSGAQAKVDTHAALTNPHSATPSATADRLILRDANGRAKVADPSAPDDIAIKNTVDTHANLIAAHGATPVAMPERIIFRDEYGRAQVAAPLSLGDIAIKYNIDIMDPWNRFVWHTCFESFDGFGGNGFKFSGDSKTPTLETLAGGSAKLHKHIEYTTALGDWGRQRRFKIHIYFDDLSKLSSVKILTGTSIVNGAKVGFHITPSYISGITADGSGETITNLVAMSTGEKSLEMHYIPDDKVLFYVNGQLKGQITTTLPSGTGYEAKYPLNILLQAEPEKIVVMSFGDYLFIQEVN